MVVFTGGGTGGHLAIVDSVADYIDDKIYIGSSNGQDRQWFEHDARFKEKIFLQTAGVVNKKGFAKLNSLWLLFKAVIKAIAYVKKSSGVFSVGGFSAAPASIAAIICFKPLYIHEQNSVTGKLNKLLKPFSKRFFHSFGQNRYPYPVRQIYFDTARKRDTLKTIIFLGGSQGAHAINKIALEVAKKYDYTIIHQCGKNDYEWLKQEYAKLDREIELFAFSKDLAQKLQEADLAVARAGASTLWELCACLLPALFIPYPYAASNHQYFNAKTLVDMNGAWMMEEKDFDISFFENINDEAIALKSQNLLNAIEAKGAKKIANCLI